MGVVAGVDTSTQSCTVELRDSSDGTLLGSGRTPHPPTWPPVSEQDPAAWWEALQVALGLALADARLQSTTIDAISVAGQCHGLIMLDSRGNVLRPAKLWNDTSSSPQASRLVAELGLAGWANSVGSVPTAAFTITKLAWVAENEPQYLPQIAHILLPHDYLSYRLTGRAITDRSEASGTGYYSAHEGRWLTEHLDQFVSSSVDWSPLLPKVLGPSDPAGLVTAEAAEALGLRRDVIVGPGGGDQHVGALGIGLAPREVLYSLGTSGVVMTTSPTPVHDVTGWVDGVADAAGGWLPLVCTLNATKVTNLFANLLGVDLAELTRLALASERRPDRMVLAAFLDGERSPDRPGSRGLLGGIRADATREEFAFAAFEGVLLGLVRGHEAIRSCGVAADGAVIATGGGARSEAYLQILADLLGTPVETRDAPEAVARGAAVQAAAVLQGLDVRGVRDSWRPPTSTVVEPRAVAPRVDDFYAKLADSVQPNE